jgi:hypothetical protein
MSDLQAIADRFEIETLRGEFTDAVMLHDYDRLASLFTPDGAVRIPHINAEAVSREEIRAGIERLQALLDYFVQTTRPGTIQLDGAADSDALAGEALSLRPVPDRTWQRHRPGADGAAPAAGQRPPRLSTGFPSHRAISR